MLFVMAQFHQVSQFAMTASRRASISYTCAFPPATSQTFAVRSDKTHWWHTAGILRFKGLFFFGNELLKRWHSYMVTANYYLLHLYRNLFLVKSSVYRIQ